MIEAYDGRELAGPSVCLFLSSSNDLRAGAPHHAERQRSVAAQESADGSGDRTPMRAISGKLQVYVRLVGDLEHRRDEVSLPEAQNRSETKS